jgi:hypothetical protein
MMLIDENNEAEIVPKKESNRYKVEKSSNTI